MEADLKKQIMTALAGIRDPELGEDLVSLDMVAGVTADSGQAAVTIVLTAPGYPGRARLEADIRAVLSGIPGVESVEVTFDTLIRSGQQETLPGVKHVVTVGSGKGGVGKSTVAANLAAALALEGASVGLLDADIYGPSQAKMFGVEGKRLMADEEKRILPLSSHGVRVISIANLVEDGQALTWRGPILHGTLTQMINQTLWGELDYLLVDMPPGTGDVQLSLSQLVPVTGAVLVTTPQEVAMLDVRRAYSMLRKTHVPVLGIIENMSWYELPDGTRDQIFGAGGAERFAEAEKIPLLGQIPVRTALREAGDSGAPLVIQEPESPSSLLFRRTARQLAARISDQSRMTLPVMGG